MEGERKEGGRRAAQRGRRDVFTNTDVCSLPIQGSPPSLLSPPTPNCINGWRREDDVCACVRVCGGGGMNGWRAQNTEWMTSLQCHFPPNPLSATSPNPPHWLLAPPPCPTPPTHTHTHLSLVATAAAAACIVGNQRLTTRLKYKYITGTHNK